MLIGYGGVSTDDQTLDLQRDALREAGSERIFEDRASRRADLWTLETTALPLQSTRIT